MNIIKNKDWNKEIVIIIVCILYFVLFIYAAASKLITYEKSELQLSKSPITTSYADILVWLIPTAEIVIAIMLISIKTRTIALYGALAMMSIFTAYIYAILNYSSSIPCSCGGVLESLNWNEHLLFNIFFMILAIIAILITTNPTKQINQKIQTQVPIPV